MVSTSNTGHTDMTIVDTIMIWPFIIVVEVRHIDVRIMDKVQDQYGLIIFTVLEGNISYPTVIILVGEITTAGIMKMQE